MSTITRNTSETSVSFSLAELARIEEERVRQEDERRARNREKEARDQREAEARRRAAEEAQAKLEAEANAKRARAEAEEKVRLEARERAAVDVARIAAAAKAQLEADSARRAHELDVLRVRTEGRQRRWVFALAGALGLVLFGSGVSAYGAVQHVAGLTQDADRLREGQQALAREREHAKATELAALDRRYAALRGRPLVRDAEEARAGAEAARNAVDAKALDADRLRVFGDALDALQGRIEALERTAALDQRRADLDAWAAERRRSEITTAARLAATRARATGDDAALRAYAGALDELRSELGQASARTGPALPSAPDPVTRTCLKGDPACGLDGKPVF
jgi:hypothetical protein